MPDPFTAAPGGAPRTRGGESLEDIFDPVEPAAPATPRTASLTSRTAPPMNLPGADPRQSRVERAASPPLLPPVPPPAPAPAPVRSMGASAGGPQSSGVDDILAGVERSSPVIRAPRQRAPIAPAGATTDVPPPEALQSFPTDEERTSVAKQPPMFARKSFIIALLSIVLLAAFGGAAWAVYTLFFSPTQPPAITTGGFPTTQQTPQPIIAPTPPTPAVTVSPVPVPAEVETDSDHDGLSDADEEKYGTNKFATDSDADGLTDRDEVKVFATQPDNADTDGDSFPDGSEVLNGYNPNGPGRIKEIPQP